MLSRRKAYLWSTLLGLISIGPNKAESWDRSEEVIRIAGHTTKNEHDVSLLGVSYREL
jgi:hypothetical protein